MEHKEQIVDKGCRDHSDASQVCEFQCHPFYHGLNFCSLHWFLVIIDMPRLAIDEEDDSESSDDCEEDIESEETGSSSSTSENELTEAQKHLKP